MPSWFNEHRSAFPSVVCGSLILGRGGQKGGAGSKPSSDNDAQADGMVAKKAEDGKPKGKKGSKQVQHPQQPEQQQQPSDAMQPPAGQKKKGKQQQSAGVKQQAQLAGEGSQILSSEPQAQQRLQSQTSTPSIVQQGKQESIRLGVHQEQIHSNEKEGGVEKSGRSTGESGGLQQGSTAS